MEKLYCSKAENVSSVMLQFSQHLCKGAKMSVFVKPFKVLCSLFLVMAFVLPALAEDVSNKHYTLPVADGWTLPVAPQEANGGSVVMLQHAGDGTAVTIAIAPSPISAKEIAEQTADNMKRSGLPIDSFVEKDGVYEFTFSQGPAKGVTFVASNGKEFSVVTVLGTDPEIGKRMLKNLKPADPKLFPKF